jgi:hypothetical protein
VLSPERLGFLLSGGGGSARSDERRGGVERRQKRRSSKASRRVGIEIEGPLVGGEKRAPGEKVLKE